MSKNNVKPVGRKADIVVQEYGTEILIYDLKIDKAFNLNETSALVWQACDGNKTVREISDQISRQLKSVVSEDFVWLALNQLKKENLIENEIDFNAPFDGLTRREAIRRVGLASLVTLPFISSLVAPTAAQAQSSGCLTGAGGIPAGGRAGCACTSGAQCPAPISCCSNIPAQPRVCLGVRTATGGDCGLACECVGNCCVNNICSSNTVTTGGTCASSCQCIGANTCQSGRCCPAGGCVA